MSKRLHLHADVATTFSLAAQKNAYPLIKRILLTATNNTDSNLSTSEKIRHIRIRLTSEPEFIDPEEWLVDVLEDGQSTKLQERSLKPHHSKIVGLTEEMQVSLIFAVSYIDESGETQEMESHYDISILPGDYWGGETRQSELLAAFVQPNTAVVQSLVSKVTQLLRISGKDSAISGYQSNTREKPFAFASGLWSVIFNERMAYVSPPVGWAERGQRIRTAVDMMNYKTAACLDTSILFASCLENMGLNPVVAMTNTHAFVGFWLIDSCFPSLVSNDAMDIRKRVATADLVMFETTLVTNDSRVTFTQAIDRANELLSEENEDEFVMVIDIKQARARKIKPLSTVEEAITENLEHNSDDIELELGTIPPLPPVRADDQVIEETPETRLDAWQRKLLDLTKRNPLLSVKTSALKLYCPDLPALEDKLAAGEKFDFISAEESPLNDSERSTEVFRMNSGNNLHREFAIQQLNLNKLIVNDAGKRTQTKLVELLRKAKNDMEEGGSNTMFISLGMLRWRETAESEKSYRAPLILLPVKLERKSAQAPVYMRQLPDEEPLFNLTLIEMLHQDYAISLDQLRKELPADESGVDVNAIWQIVRQAIAQQPGFEVVEEIVLGSFSFAKYLMWKDLRHRVDMLKQNPFVEHLVDRPSQSYQQDSQFLEQREVDEKISPEEFFAPLNCDSSQMVAVEASAHPQDFVLEGPPGTGKSETITNMICHNFALGRKVLFVAEKMAALQVVYRRMEKIGLDHLCLELHSNKSNKKAVIEQLGRAWSRREAATQSQWIERAQELKRVRHHLNHYVSELHCKHSLGFSARDTMARVVRYQHIHPLRLDWPNEMSQAPIHSEEQVDGYLKAAKDLGISFSQVTDLEANKFNAITQTEWSHQWRTDTVSLANRIEQTCGRAEQTAEQLLETLNLTLDKITPTHLSRLAGIAELSELVMMNSLDFALSSGGSQRVNAIQTAVGIKDMLDEQINRFGYNLTYSHLSDCPWEQWIKQRDQAVGLLGFFKRWGLKSDIKKTGLPKFDLGMLEQAVEARETLLKLNIATIDLKDTKVWSDGCINREKLVADIRHGHRAVELFNDFLANFKDPIDAATSLRRIFIDGREFLTASSALVTAAKQVSDSHQALQELTERAAQQRVTIAPNHWLQEIATDFRVISENADKLNRWCLWLAAKQHASGFGLTPLATALEDRVIEHEQCEDNAMTALCIWLAPMLVDQSPTLRQFAGANHESTIETFRELDAEVSQTSAEYIAAKTAGLIPDRTARDAPQEYGVLARELTRQRGHKPVRTLVQEMGNVLTDLTPCFMMSPLSVAQFLPADFALFDLVIFDEASQITTWDAVGAIARGKNVIVVGDPKQMPPSNNFGRKDDDDPDEGDLESILDQALAARLPHLRLMGHYRSRHETLIAFSNSHYYENKLATFPSAETKESAVTLHRVDGVYGKGKTQTNTIEAKAVVGEVVRRLHEMLVGKPVKSMGIVTINSNQQRLVEDLMDEARRNDPRLEQFFTATDTFDPIFVKNLESVQGDQRDIILLSLTYGPTEPGGRTMSMNFGPLNKAGGERRLNVAITRATTEVLVFASFDSSMVDLSRTQATAVEHLKNYLEFAERGPVALAEYSSANYGLDHFDSDFEQAVAHTLREKGWKVQTQVGVSKFRVDLGVIHPDHPGEYLAGIECDGATYHGSPSARDRDRVRQAILENLGWRIIRLWSTDYFNESDYAMKKVLDQLDKLLEDDRNKPEPEPIQEPTPYTPDVEDSIVVPRNQEPTLEIPSNDVETDKSVHICPILEGLPVYHRDVYFNDDHSDNLDALAKAVLERKNGITLHELNLDVANLHGITRTSRKQIQHLKGLIHGWAGMVPHGDTTTVWLSPTDIEPEIRWRGLDAFGEERSWTSLPVEEQRGIARAAKQKQPNDPVDWLFNEFKIGRRHTKTADIFQSWIDQID